MRMKTKLYMCLNHNTIHLYKLGKTLVIKINYAQRFQLHVSNFGTHSYPLHRTQSYGIRAFYL